MADQTSSEVFAALRQDVQDFGDKWEGYLLGMAVAYSTAYESQAAILQQVKGVLEARRQEEQQNMLLALSILTAGAGGALSTYFGKKIGPAVAVAADEPITKHVVIAASSAVITETAKLPVKMNADVVLEKLGLKSSYNSNQPTDPFVPTGVTPAKYGFLLQQGAKECKNRIADMVRPWPDVGASVPLLVAKAIRYAMERTFFFAEAPPSEMDEKTSALLTSRAELALWISWGLERDREYWEKQAALRWYGPKMDEEFYWDPLRVKLIALGVPASVVSLPNVGFGTPQGMDMYGFMKWVKSPQAFNALYAGLRPHEDGLRWAEKRWRQKVQTAT
jgi:hypothetical protein